MPPTTAPSPIDGIDPTILSVSSIAAVIMATLMIVQFFIKPIFGNLPKMSQIPMVVYVVVVSLILTIFANKVLKTLPGDNVYLLVFQAFMSALASSGLYKLPSSIQSVGSVTNSSGPSASIFTLAFCTTMLMAIASGCSHASSAFYQGVKAQWPPIEKTYNRYVDADPTLSAQDKAVLKESAATMDKLIAVEGGAQAPTTQPAASQP